MKLSARVQALTSSPIRKLTPYADAAKAAGKKVYHLNIGQPDIKTPDQFMNSIRQYEAPVIAYSNSKGEMFLLKSIQKYYAEKGMDYAIEDIFVTNGGSEALIMAVMALCDTGDEIMVFEPFYANYTTFCKEFGAKINAVPTSVDNGYHLSSQEEIEKHITPNTKAILLTNPGNPTGVVYTAEEQDMIARIVKKYDLALIADEVYREFVYDGAYRSFGTMPELDDNLIIIDSV
ncbi:MAG: aminotransferase class I/II-fold pyridoxal phosphate-dependent enzyme, partial [Phascolarctobacterium sp.]